MMEDEFRLGDFDWRENAGDEQVLLSGCLVAFEKEVYFAVEKLTPFLRKTESRYPNEDDIATFILIMRGP